MNMYKHNNWYFLLFNLCSVLPCHIIYFLFLFNLRVTTSIILSPSGSANMSLSLWPLRLICIKKEETPSSRRSFIPCKDLYDIIYITESRDPPKTTIYINGKTLILWRTSGLLQCGKSMHDGKIEHGYFDVKLAF